MKVQSITLKRVAALRELASLGLWEAKAARTMGLPHSSVMRLRVIYRIEFPPAPCRRTTLGHASAERTKSEFRRLVAQRYGEGVSPAEIAAETGKTIKHVMVAASQMGVTAGHRDAAKFRRGFAVPRDLMPKYLELRAIGLTIEESGIAVGLLPRRARIAA